MNHNSTFSNLSDKDKIDFYIAMAVIALFGVFILYYTFPTEHDSNVQSILVDNSQKIEKINVDDNVYMPVTNEVLQRNKETQVEKIKSNQLPDNIQSTKQAAPVKLYKSNSLPDTTSQKVNSDNLEVIDKDIINTPIDDVQESNIIDIDSIDTNIDINPPALESIDPAPKSKEEIKPKIDETSCIIIIGAFDKEKSKSKLLSRLKKDNYNIFKTPYKSLTRIGVYLPCDKMTIENELVKIRKKYAKDAMLLRKEN